MANGIYTALDYDMDYLAHSGRKGMKWYNHLFGVQQSLNKYAKGLATKGVTAKAYATTNAKIAGLGAKSAIGKLRGGDVKGAAKDAARAAASAARAAKYGVSALAYKGASKVVGAAASAARKLHYTGQRIDNWIHNANYRRVRISRMKTKAKNFTNMIGEAIRSIPGKVRDTYKNLRKKRAINKYTVSV